MAIIAISSSSCSETETSLDQPEINLPELPLVETATISAISYFTAVSGGNITVSENTAILTKGICWDTLSNPTIFSDHDYWIDQSNEFEIEMTNLKMGKSYNVRAFAITETDTIYGQVESFETLLSDIRYIEDGRIVKLQDTDPLILSIGPDSQIDYTIFVMAVYMGGKVQLNVGINPIGFNAVKSGPASDDRFQNMGLVISANQDSLISDALQDNQYWTTDHSALVIRYLHSNNTFSYEGDWASEDRIAPIRFYSNNELHFGWLRIRFLNDSDSAQLIDYAYHAEPGKPIKAGQKF